ncbi:MAG: response regulator transcription factor [Crocinitomicaceae bacterium]|jgi:DNA-binding NarL/FixJ family response regulator|nr:response regulator transcription factor [Crocinitomicaceae bacterium]
MEAVNVVIADSSELIRIGLKAIFVQSEIISIVGEANSNNELKELATSRKPDIIIVDYTSKDFDIRVIPEVLQRLPSVRFVAITKDQSAQTIVDALRSGVTSYVKKDCSAHEITESVIETAAGKKFFCGQILERIREEKINVDDIDFEQLSCEPISLSEREQEVIKMIAEGYTNAQIAEKIFLSNHTVNTHRKNIMRKLGVNNTAGIVMYAVKTQLVSPNKFLFTSTIS